jgi:endoglucanase
MPSFCALSVSAMLSWFGQPACNGLDYVGVNLAGAEFAEQVLPGTYGKDYTYPNRQELEYFAAKDMTVIRLPFRWERLQPNAGEPLDADELKRLQTVVKDAAALKLSVVLDVHNYGLRFGEAIGSEAVPDDMFADLWGRLAQKFKDSPNIIYGLMNEPYKQSPASWIKSANTAIARIRAQGAKQRILVPGTSWTGAWSWITSDNAKDVGTGVVDPLNFYSFELHQYLDPDSSGRTSDVVSPTIGAERLEAATKWATEKHATLFLGEFGASDDPASLEALKNMLQYMKDHSRVWIGATYWAAGPWWYNSNIYGIEPEGLGTKQVTDRPQLKLLQSLLRKS